jgi:RNA polymerase sigma-70 factor, ECF subfamily
MNDSSQSVNNLKLSKTEEIEYTKVYRQYHEDILRYVYSRVNSKEQAVDITSVVFVKLFTNWRDIEQDTVRAWLYTVAKNQLIDYYRSKKEDISLEDRFYQLSDTENNTEDKAIKDIKKDKLAKAISSLGKVDKEILNLRIYEELTFKEISVVVEMSKGAVKMRYYRAVDKLEKNYSKNNKLL